MTKWSIVQLKEIYYDFCFQKLAQFHEMSVACFGQNTKGIQYKSFSTMSLPQFIAGGFRGGVFQEWFVTFEISVAAFLLLLEYNKLSMILWEDKDVLLWDLGLAVNSCLNTPQKCIQAQIILV